MAVASMEAPACATPFSTVRVLASTTQKNGALMSILRVSVESR